MAWERRVALGVAVLALGAGYFLVLMAVGSALRGIFLAALYQYAANGEVPAGFEREEMAGAFEPKK